MTFDDLLAQALAADERGDQRASWTLWRIIVAVLPEQAALTGGLAAQTPGPAAALTWFSRSARLDPTQVLFHLGTVDAARRSGRPDGGWAAAQRALILEPGMAAALNDLGVLAGDRHDGAAAARWLGRAAMVEPDDPARLIAAIDPALALCQFDAVEQWAAGLRRRLTTWLAGSLDWAPLGQMIYLAPYLDLEQSQQRQIGARASALMAAAARPPLVHPAPRQSARLRIGYVSADFGNRPMGQVLAGALAAHDPARFAVHLYSLKDRSGDRGPLMERLQQVGEGMRDLSGLDARAAAQVIAGDQLDLLVDLHGIMQDGRPLLFAFRPAPVQAYWIGHHGGGLSLDHIDYAIADHVALTAEWRRGLREAVLFLPGAYHPAEMPNIPDLTLSRQDFGLPDHGTVFCAFNNPQKIDRVCFAAWMEILRHVDGSVLWLSNPQRQPALEHNLRQAAAAHRIDPARLVFAGFVADKGIHLARHRLADLFLDAFRATASTTALDALAAGLPVLTRAGRGIAERIATTFLTHLGMPDLVCPDTSTFMARAIEIAADPQATKARLAAFLPGAAIFDPRQFTPRLEAGYEAMIGRQRAGHPPADIEII